MIRLTVLALVAALGLAACGSGQSPEAAPQTEGEPVALPSVARIVCKAGGPPLIATPAVKPQRDGVHLEIVNETGSDLTLGLPLLSTGAPAGTSTQVVDLGPGELTVTCSGPETLADGEPPGAPLEVVDEDGVWVSTLLDCPDQFSSVADYAVGARGRTSDPVEAARNALEGYGLEPDDVFERAGYPDAEVVRVRLVRDGEPLAVVDLLDDGTGKWLESMVTGCSSLAG